MNLKKLLPYENYTLSTNLSPNEVYKRLADNIEPKKSFRFSFFGNNTATKKYEGYISADTFAVSRIISYRNSFLPEISGNISTVAGQTQIKIVMKPEILVIVFMSCWMGAVGLVCIAILIAGIFGMSSKDQHGNSSPMVLIPFAMFIFGWALIYFGFKAESKRSKDFFASLLNGHEV